jgi:hypothetical protein
MYVMIRVAQVCLYKSEIAPPDVMHEILTNASTAVSRWDRMLIFGGCNLAALACFVVCFALFPILFATPRKFAVL